VLLGLHDGRDSAGAPILEAEEEEEDPDQKADRACTRLSPSDDALRMLDESSCLPCQRVATEKPHLRWPWARHARIRSA
jgi:hypothetical protein